MPYPLVSIVIPVYNGERYLAAALKSVFEQEYAPFEVIVVDDGSTDQSAEIAQSFPGVRYIYQDNQGVAYAWNAGIRAAQGELVAFLAQDDLWTSNKLRVQVGYMVAHPEVQYTVAKMRCFLDPGCPLPPGFRPELLEREHLARIPEALVARKALFDLLGAWDTTLTTSHDVDWFARAGDANVPFAVIPEVLLYRRIHRQNQTFQLLSDNDANLLQVLRKSVQRKRGQSKGR